MSYTHLNINELVFVEEYYKLQLSGRIIAQKMKRSHETIYRVIRKLKAGMTAHEIHENYLENKNKCGRNKIVLTEEEVAYVKKPSSVGLQMSL